MGSSWLRSEESAWPEFEQVGGGIGVCVPFVYVHTYVFRGEGEGEGQRDGGRTG